MKMTMKIMLLLAVVGTSLTSCAVWQEEWSECIPLPQADTEVDTDPWEPGGTEEKPIGE